MADVRYLILEKKVSHERIDGEVIVLQFDTGFYYSLNDGAGRVWEWMAGGASWPQIQEAFEPLQPDQRAALDAFAEQLLQENLVVKSEAAASGTPALPRHATVFEHPRMEKYGDMQDLLLADPIHEVDEAGWPRPQAN